MRSLIHFSLRDSLTLLAMIPLSSGLVWLGNTASGAVLDFFWPTVEAMLDSIAPKVGGLYTPQRRFVIYGISGMASGLLLSCLIVLLLLLRNNWATLVAFSLPFSLLFELFMIPWMVAVPLTNGAVSVLVQPLVVAAIVAVCLFAFCLFCRRRIQRAEFQTKVAATERSSWQRTLLLTAFVTYLLSCAYGWYGMASFRADSIEAQRDWENYWENIE